MEKMLEGTSLGVDEEIDREYRVSQEGGLEMMDASILVAL